MLDKRHRGAETAAFQTEKMIGRQKHLQMVHQAIGDARNSHVLFFEGDGGIGKTRLLQEVGKWVNELRQSGQKRLRWSQIIDLYHSEMHSNSGIEEALIHSLDPGQEFFVEYREKRKVFEVQRLRGLGGSALETARQELTKTFLRDFNRMAQAHRLVLTFDTLELVQYESSEVQALCEVEDNTTSVKNWFLDLVPYFKNTITIFAGRPHALLQADFKEYFQQVEYGFLPIEPFTEREAKMYLGELAKMHAGLGPVMEKPDLFRQIYQGSGNGRPIYISLLADLLRPEFSTSLSDIFPPDQPDIGEAERQQMKAAIARQLVNLPEPIGDIVHYLAYARTGLNKDLLLKLVDGALSDTEVDKAFHVLRHFTFIKTRPNDPGTLFLHDEVFDLLDEYHLQSYPETLRNFKRLRDHYQSQVDWLTLRLEEMGVPADEQAQEERASCEAELQAARLKFLYYQMQVNPVEGYYRTSNRLTEEAIKSHRTGFDMRLRDTVLGFLNYLQKEPLTPRKKWLSERLGSLDEIKRNNAVLWLKRYNARGDFGKSRRVAGHIRESDHPAFQWPQVQDPLFKASLLTALGEAMYFTNAPQKEVLQVLQQVFPLLADEQAFTGEEKDTFWRRTRVLGLANNEVGFAYRLNHQFSTAIPYYQQAITLYRQVDVISEMASAVTNLAYAYARLGAIDEAEALAEDAIDIWRRHYGQPYNLALSINARGAICIEADQPHRARALCQRAFDLFATTIADLDDSGDRRGKALSLLRLGQAYRRLAKLHFMGIYGREEAHDYLLQGRNCLQDSMELFSELKNQQAYLEALAELGRLYRDWSMLAFHYREKHDAREKYSQAENYLQSALSLTRAREDSQHLTADVLQDLAVLYRKAERLDKAQTMQDEASSCIPELYKLQKGIGFIDIEQPISSYWAILGKIHLLRGVMIFDNEQTQTDTRISGKRKDTLIREGMNHFVFAIAYFQQCTITRDSANPKMKQTKEAIYGRLKTYKAERLEKIMAEARQTAADYHISAQAQPVFNYLERTLGI